MFSRLIRFMCGHMLQGPHELGDRRVSAWTLSAIEHSVISTTCLGLRSAT